MVPMSLKNVPQFVHETWQSQIKGGAEPVFSECIAHKQSTVGYHPITVGYHPIASKPAHKQLQNYAWMGKQKQNWCGQGGK